MKKGLIPALAVLAAATMLGGCAKETNCGRPESGLIGFGTYSDKISRAVGIPDAAGLAAGGGFVVYSCTHEGTYPASGVFDAYMQGLEVTSADNGAGWGYNATYYWPQTKNVSFFAYNKPSADVTASYAAGAGPDYNPTITFTQNADPAKHFDLVTATAKDRNKAGGTVQMSFGHVLSRIGFKYTATVEPGTTITVTSATLKGYNTLANSGTYTYGAAAGSEWSSPGVSGTPVADLPITPLLTSGTPGDFLFMIPQPTGASLQLAVSYTVSTADASLPSGKFEYDVTKTVAIPAATWAAGSSYTYNFTISPTQASFNDITVGKWTSFIDVPAFFPVNVWIPSNGVSSITDNLRVDLSGYAEQQWELTSDASWLKLSLSADGGDPQTTLRGIGSQKIYTVAEANPSGGVRTASLSTPAGVACQVTQGSHNVNSANTPPAGVTTYIGAFWRRAETGERLIRIPVGTDANNTGKWMATVVWKDSKWNDGDIILSMNDLPGYPAGFISGTDTPAVGGDGSGVGGDVAASENIYFRIGLKTQYTATSGYNLNAAPARYAVIALSYNNYTKAQLIYLRQGEDPDYLMRTTDACNSGGFNSATRPAAVRFSPYNLTVGTFNAQANRSGATNPTRFTDYPTKAGAFFQWGNTTNPRYAYNSIGATVSGWSGENPSGYWNESTYETCPSGYTLSDGSTATFRRPSDGSTSSGNTAGAVSGSEMRQSLWLNPQSGSGISNTDNTVVGYYADGFFDRGLIIDGFGTSFIANSTVKDNWDLAHVGRLFFNMTNHASLFFPIAGCRNASVGELQHMGNVGHYWSSSSKDYGDSWDFYSYNGAKAQLNMRANAGSIRCVRQ